MLNLFVYTSLSKHERETKIGWESKKTVLAVSLIGISGREIMGKHLSK